jgi:sensor c-di-GMP phosphodiesterase-like protein
VPQILAMAEILDLEVIVEGVETEEQAEYFRNCARPLLAQGWYFGHPVPAAEFRCMLAEDERKAQQLVCEA